MSNKFKKVLEEVKTYPTGHTFCLSSLAVKHGLSSMELGYEIYRKKLAKKQAKGIYVIPNKESHETVKQPIVGRNKVYSQQEKDQIITKVYEKLAQGKPLFEIAREVGVSYSQLVKWSEQDVFSTMPSLVKNPNNSYTAKSIQNVTEWVKKNKVSIPQTAHKLGVDEKLLNIWLDNPLDKPEAPVCPRLVKNARGYYTKESVNNLFNWIEENKYSYVQAEQLLGLTKGNLSHLKNRFKNRVEETEVKLNPPPLVKGKQGFYTLESKQQLFKWMAENNASEYQTEKALGLSHGQLYAMKKKIQMENIPHFPEEQMTSPEPEVIEAPKPLSTTLYDYVKSTNNPQYLKASGQIMKDDIVSVICYCGTYIPQVCESVRTSWNNTVREVLVEGLWYPEGVVQKLTKLVLT